MIILTHSAFYHIYLKNIEKAWKNHFFYDYPYSLIPMSRGKGLHHTYMKNFEKYEKINFFFDDYVYSLVSPIAISITLIRKKIQKNEKKKIMTTSAHW